MVESWTRALLQPSEGLGANGISTFAAMKPVLHNWGRRKEVLEGGLRGVSNLVAQSFPLETHVDSPIKHTGLCEMDE
jgi:hypothetical protein